MAQDYLPEVRHVARAFLRQSAPILSFFPYGSIYGGTVPADRTFPFLRAATGLASPFRASGLDSSTLRMSWQGFTKDIVNGAGEVMEHAEDRAHRMGAAIAGVLGDKTLDLGNGMKARFTWIQSSPTIDGDEPGAWMTTVTFGVEVAG